MRENTLGRQGGCRARRTACVVQHPLPGKPCPVSTSRQELTTTPKEKTRFTPKTKEPLYVMPRGEEPAKLDGSHHQSQLNIKQSKKKGKTHETP